MHGIRIVSKDAFLDLFSPLLSVINGYKWLFDADAFTIDTDHESNLFSNEFLAITEKTWRGTLKEYGCFCEHDIFPKYAKYVVEDWNSIYAVKELKGAPIDWFKSCFKSSDRAKFIDSTVSLCFLNIDAAYWEFYSQDERHVKIVSEHASSLNGTRIEKCILSKSSGL
jgi:hypothetical protein